MDQKEINNDKPLMCEKKPSMKRRSVHNDYYGRRVYMLTLAVEGRRAILGKLVGDVNDEANPPRIDLSPLGKAVQACWDNIPKYHPEVKCLKLQIMPDHLHGILFVERAIDIHMGQVVSGFKAGCNKAYREIYSEAVPLSTRMKAVPLSTRRAVEPLSPGKAAVPLDKENQVASSNMEPLAVSLNKESQAASSCYTAPPYSNLPLPSQMRLKKDDRSKGLLFERGYNDLINKHYDMLPRMLNYLDDNPRRLAIKRAHPDYFKVRFGIRIGEQTYAAIGNRFLLDHPDKLQVQCTRRLTDDEVRSTTEQYISKARQGAILVSPAISKGEQHVMRTALDEHLPIIFLTPWGFTTFSKPGHQYYNACAEGRLLILAPWEHQTQRIPLTRAMCLQLNSMTKDICQL
jgi:hypothetical protein